MSKKYTFKDWLTGKIKTENLTSLILQYHINKDHGMNEPCLPPDEVTKIRKVQKETFHKAVELTSQTEIRVIKQAIENGEVRSPKNTLRLEIEKAEQFISENPELESRYERYKTEHGGIRPDEVERINQMYRNFENNPNFGGWAGFCAGEKGNRKPLRLTDLYINKIYLEALKEIQSKLDGQGSVDIDIKKTNRPKPKNDTAQKMYEVEKKNQPKKEAIINKAVEIIRSTGREFKTKSNNCQKWLWDDARINKIDSGNARGWLDNAIKDGTINRKLKELPME
ncbi:MAG: hypothetical protein JJU13_17460 [Balneolaceae bacterium]|nr:hypothetical protein [Balneolaceae bacterium]